MPAKSSLLASTMLSGVVGSSLLAATPAAAVDRTPAVSFDQMPAVDGVNWKADGVGGTFSNRGLGAGRGAVTVPFSNRWGFQVDGLAGTYDNRFLGAIAGHLFWRDPAIGLIGLYASHTRWDQFGGVRATHVAVEGELYRGRFTIQGIVGVESNSAALLVTTTVSPPVNPTTINQLTETIGGGTRFFDQFNLAYYPIDNLKTYIGHRYLGGKHAGAAGFEIGVPVGRGAMTSLFAEARAGEGGHHGAWAGLRVYFGKNDKPLIRRHREDDPWLDWVPASVLAIVGNYSSSSRSWTCPPGEFVIIGSNGPTCS